MATREFNADKRREAREKAAIIIDGETFRRRRMTGARFREILDEEPGMQRKTQAELEELTPPERDDYARAVGRENYESVYRQIAQLIEPVEGESTDVPSHEGGLCDWLDEHLDWDDAGPLIEWLDDLSGSGRKGNAAA